MTDNNTTAKRPWYKEGYVWLIISFPALAIVGGMVMLYLANTTHDGLVFDDYYKRGLQINLSLARDKTAAEYGMQATVQVQQQRVYVYLTKATDVVYQFPQQLLMHLSHHTRNGFDQDIVLARVGDNAYQGTLPALIEGVWSVQIATEEWRLLKSVRLSTTNEFELVPNLPTAAASN